MGDNNQDSISPDGSATEQNDVQSFGADTGSSPDTDVSPSGADAGSSAADTGETPSLLDVVRSAAPDREEEGETDSPSDETDSDTESEQDEGSEGDETDGAEETGNEEENVPFNKHPRFQKLVQERNALKTDVERYKRGHEQFEKVQDYMRQNGLSGEDVEQALNVQALLRSDPAKAWEQLRPVVQDLLVKTGEILPNDLKQEVQQGRLTKDRAMEISRMRAREAGQQTRQEHTQRVQQETQQHQQVRGMQDAAAQWETAKRQKDPEFEAKAEALQKEVLWLQRQGMPKDGAGVRQLLDQAYRNITKGAQAARPKPAVNSLRGNGASGGTPNTPPRSVMDIVQRGG